MSVIIVGYLMPSELISYINTTWLKQPIPYKWAKWQPVREYVGGGHNRLRQNLRNSNHR